MKNQTRNTLVATVASVLLAGGAFQALADDGRHATNPTFAIPLAQALEIAQAAVPGDVHEIELEQEKGQSHWEIELIDSNGQEVEITVDAQTGELLSQTSEADDD